MKKNWNLYGISLKGYWNDIGSLEEYINTNFDFFKGEIDLPLEACCVLDNNIWLQDGVEIDETAELEGPLFIGEGTRIGKGARVANSIIGRNNYIQPHASIKKSILWDNNFVGANAEIRGAVITENVVVRERGSIFDLAAVGEKVVIGEESKVAPGIKIWPEREIESRVEVRDNIVWRPRWQKKTIYQYRGYRGREYRYYP